MTKCTCSAITPAASAATGEHHYTSCPMYMAELAEGTIADDGSKSIGCSECDQQFATAEEAEVHGRTHTDPIGRIAKWLGEAREAGYSDREIAAMLVEGAPNMTEQVAKAKAMADQLDEMASNEEQTSPIDGRTK